MIVTRKHPFTGETNCRDLPITIEEVVRWNSGELIQNVWPHLSANDREFILSGITDWENCLPEYIEDDSEIKGAQEIKTAPETSESVEMDLLANSSEGIPVETPKVWTPPSKKVYSTKRFATHKLRNLWPVFPYLDSNTILAGGSLRTILNCAAEKVSDFDLFFKSFQGVPALREKLLAAGWENVFSCPEEKLFTYKKGSHKLQLICETEFSSPAQLIESFDLTPCVSAYYDGEIFFTREFVRSVFKKRARIQNVSFPIATIKRIVKYAQKGYSISMAAEDLIRLTNGISFDGSDFRHYID